jgi:hypothetical protein
MASLNKEKNETPLLFLPTNRLWAQYLKTRITLDGKFNTREDHKSCPVQTAENLLFGSSVSSSNLNSKV